MPTYDVTIVRTECRQLTFRVTAEDRDAAQFAADNEASDLSDLNWHTEATSVTEDIQIVSIKEVTNASATARVRRVPT